MIEIEDGSILLNIYNKLVTNLLLQSLEERQDRHFGGRGPTADPARPATSRLSRFKMCYLVGTILRPAQEHHLDLLRFFWPSPRPLSPII